MIKRLFAFISLALIALFSFWVAPSAKAQNFIGVPYSEVRPHISFAGIEFLGSKIRAGPVDGNSRKQNSLKLIDNAMCASG